MELLLLCFTEFLAPFVFANLPLIYDMDYSNYGLI